MLVKQLSVDRRVSFLVVWSSKPDAGTVVAGSLSLPAAAVINNLVASPALHLFKSSQLAAWLSPALRRSFAWIIY